MRCFTAARPVYLAYQGIGKIDVSVHKSPRARAHGVPNFQHDIAAGEELRNDFSGFLPVKPVAAKRTQTISHRTTRSINPGFSGVQPGCHELASLLPLAWIVVDETTEYHIGVETDHRFLYRMSASTDQLPLRDHFIHFLECQTPRRLAENAEEIPEFRSFICQYNPVAVFNCEADLCAGAQSQAFPVSLGIVTCPLSVTVASYYGVAGAFAK